MANPMFVASLRNVPGILRVQSHAVFLETDEQDVQDGHRTEFPDPR